MIIISHTPSCHAKMEGRRFPLPKKSLHLTLRGRIVLFLAAFIAALLVQWYMNWYQSARILTKLDEQTGNFHSISQFLRGIEDSLDILANYHWDYGETDAFFASMQAAMQDADGWLAKIDREMGSVSEEQYLLANAAGTTYDTYQSIVDKILTAVQADDISTAVELYVNQGAPCGSYLSQYTQQLLETAITDGQATYAQLSSLNQTLRTAQNVMLGVCIVLGALTLVSVLRILTPVQEMIQVSSALAKGEYETPDVPVRREDEIGRLAGAFNRMKRSMAEQVKTLQEKNEIQHELYQKENEALELQNLMERETLQQLRSQVQPHFLFNTLNVILHTAGQESAYRTQALITALSHLLRYSLESNDVLVPLSREIRIIDEFYSLYHVRFGDRIKLEWRISGEIDLTETMGPSFLLQPLVENAFKHGICPKEEGGKVRIRINRLARKGLLYISVSDNGLGMDKETLAQLRNKLKDPPTNGAHIGVYNVAARLRLIDPRCRFDIHARQGRGTCAVMYLPLVENAEEEEEPEQ